MLAISDSLDEYGVLDKIAAIDRWNITMLNDY